MKWINSLTISIMLFCGSMAMLCYQIYDYNITQTLIKKYESDFYRIYSINTPVLYGNLEGVIVDSNFYNGTAEVIFKDGRILSVRAIALVVLDPSKRMVE